MFSFQLAHGRRRWQPLPRKRVTSSKTIDRRGAAYRLALLFCLQHPLVGLEQDEGGRFVAVYIQEVSPLLP